MILPRKRRCCCCCCYPIWMCERRSLWYRDCCCSFEKMNETGVGSWELRRSSCCIQRTTPQQVARRAQWIESGVVHESGVCLFYLSISTRNNNNQIQNPTFGHHTWQHSCSHLLLGYREARPHVLTTHIPVEMRTTMNQTKQRISNVVTSACVMMMMVFSVQPAAAVEAGRRILAITTTTTTILQNTPINAPNNRRHPLSSSTTATAKIPFLMRGGSSSSAAEDPNKKKKKKKKRSKKPSQESSSRDSSKAHIDAKLKEKDAAEALGDAIRERADQLRYDDKNPPFVERIERSVSSLGWALGAADERAQTTQQQQQQQQQQLLEEEGGGVEAAPTSVLVHYFLKSHGGAHALQCFCSLLATVAGLGAILLPVGRKAVTVDDAAAVAKWQALSLTLIKRCMLFAMVKHVSGLLAATVLTARAIPQVGLRQARQWMEELVTDPVSQYVFYTACVMVWLPNLKATTTTTGSNAATTAAVWWQSNPLIPFVLVGPIVLRELVSIVLVISDVLVLWTLSTGKSNAFGEAILRTGQAVTDVIMSLLVTPTVWRSAHAAERQAILAKLTSRVTLALEVAVGLLMAVDAAWTLLGFTFASLPQRQPVGQVLKRLVCTRLYLHFLWMRRKKITKLATMMRGGANQLPTYVWHVLMNPVESMGLDYVIRQRRRANSDGDEDDDDVPLTWIDYVLIGLGLDENDSGSQNDDRIGRWLVVAMWAGRS